jgi:hypothetical protein
VRVRRLAWLLAITACGGTNATTTVFDPNGAKVAPVDVATSSDVEHPFPALDSPDVPGGKGWVGVSVLGDRVRFARPRGWSVRDASLEPGHGYVRYISPNAYSFAIYERTDGAGEDWHDIFLRYEGDVAASGAKIVAAHIPVATAGNQGREYTIERHIEAKPPIVSHSREILVRGEHRIVLVQIVTDEESVSRIAGEILDVIHRLEVL